MQGYANLVSPVLKWENICVPRCEQGFIAINPSFEKQPPLCLTNYCKRSTWFRSIDDDLASAICPSGSGATSGRLGGGTMEAGKPIFKYAELEITKRNFGQRRPLLARRQRVGRSVRFEGAIVAPSRINAPRIQQWVLAEF